MGVKIWEGDILKEEIDKSIKTILEGLNNLQTEVDKDYASLRELKSSLLFLNTKIENRFVLSIYSTERTSLTTFKTLLSEIIEKHLSNIE